MKRFCVALANVSFVLLLVCFGFNSSVYALDLHQAKAAGLVGELRSGYLGAVKAEAGSEIRTLIDDINAKRRAKYKEIAGKNGTDLAAVEALAAKKAIEKTAAGQFFQSSSGSWQKK